LSDAAVAIANLVYAYAERVDLGDFDGVGALFADATYRAVVGTEVVTVAGADVTRTLTSMVMIYDGIPSTKHLTTNLIIEVDGAEATCRSYFTVLQAVAGLALQPIVAGRYHDRFTLVDGQWRFTDRLIHTDLVGDVSRHLRVNPY
jgi:3-phenylpropionate/cinnamic acid dioxygenase small subunit